MIISMELLDKDGVGGVGGVTWFMWFETDREQASEKGCGCGFCCHVRYKDRTAR